MSITTIYATTYSCRSIEIQYPATSGTCRRGRLTSPAPTGSWNGVMDGGYLIPPDIRGAAGPVYVMETTNQQFNIYTKTGTLVSTLSISNFFSATGGGGYFDPHVVYDPNYGRFVVCMDGNYQNGANSGLFVGVSQTSDPTGAWYVYSFDAIGNSSDFLDYPLLGYNTNWVVMTGNDFLGNGGNAAKIYALERIGLYSGTLGTVHAFTDNYIFGMGPTQTNDITQTTEYLVQDWNSDSTGYGYMKIGTITGPANAPVYSQGFLVGINQPWSEGGVPAVEAGGTGTIENGDTRTGNTVYINGSLWFTHTVFMPPSNPTYSVVDWWQVNPVTPTVQQFGRVGDASRFLYYPSIAVNPTNDVILGYCESSSTEYASASYSFHAHTDAPNTMESTYQYKTGLAYYYKDFGSGRNRWGDFSEARH